MSVHPPDISPTKDSRIAVRAVSLMQTTLSRFGVRPLYDRTPERVRPRRVRERRSARDGGPDRLSHNDSSHVVSTGARHRTDPRPIVGGGFSGEERHGTATWRRHLRA